jgi:hypothetical protein
MVAGSGESATCTATPFETGWADPSDDRVASNANIS